MKINIARFQAREYTVATPVYEGPLDLLLHLIERAELDITALSLAQVTDQYLAHIENMRAAIGPQEISAFLVIAARLLQIKSEALLPRPPQRAPEEEDPGEALAAQLRLYKRFKEVAAWLRSREAANWRTYLRLAPPPRIEPRLEAGMLSLEDLLRAAEAAFAQEQEKQALGTVIRRPRITIRQKIAVIREKLRQRSDVAFRELLTQRPSRLEVVVYFLAMMELIKRQHVDARRDDLFGEIVITRSDSWQDDAPLEVEFE